MAYALILFTAGAALVNVLFFSARPLYPAYASPHDGLGLSPLTDQRAAGMVMMLEQLLVLGTLVTVLLRARVRELVSLPVEVPAPAARHPITY